MNIDTVKELAEVPVLEKAYDDLVIPPLSRLAKCSVCYQERLPFGFRLGTDGSEQGREHRAHHRCYGISC